MSKPLLTVICRRGPKMRRAAWGYTFAAIGLYLSAIVTFGSVTMLVAGSFGARYVSLAIHCFTYSARYDSGLITVRQWPHKSHTVVANRIELVRAHTDRVFRYGMIGTTIWGPAIPRRAWLRHEHLVALFTDGNKPAVVLDRRAENHDKLAEALLERLPARISIGQRGLLERDVIRPQTGRAADAQLWEW